ncbi:MAG TPA: PAS domain S-box protein, partial [Opitutaceae bacterium]|nr:PAS domain S-box protein [Opitutaceae bacterium]
MKTNITNSLRWRKSAVNSGVAVLSVIIALAIARVLRTEYGFEPWNPFLCAIMFSAWFGGAMPGLVATGLSLLAFYYHFLAQAPSLGVESDLPRVLLALLTALFIVALSTAQRGAKAALHASERHFHSLFENMAESVVYFRMLFAAGRPQDAVYVEVNPAWKKLIGLTDIVGRRVSEVTPAIREPKSELFERSGRVALTGEAERFETYCASLKKWLSISAYCPKTEHVIAVIDDVTERKRADEVLRQNEFELAEAQRVAQIGSWAVDVATHTIRMSEELYRIFEVDKSTVDDKYEAFWSTVHLDDRGRVAQVIAEAKSTGQPYEVEFRIKTRSGQQKHIRALETLRRDGGGAVSVRFGIAQDITKQKEAEAAIRQAEQSIRLSIDAIPTMAWSVRPDGTVDFLNRRWLEYSGLSFEEYARDPMGPIHPADAPGIVERWRAHMAAGRYYEDEMRLRRADGEYRWFLIRTAPLHDDNGNIVKWFGSGVDIEDRKEAEEALRRSEQELRKREEL